MKKKAQGLSVRVHTLRVSSARTAMPTSSSLQLGRRSSDPSSGKRHEAGEARPLFYNAGQMHIKVKSVYIYMPFPLHD